MPRGSRSRRVHWRGERSLCEARDRGSDEKKEIAMTRSRKRWSVMLSVIGIVTALLAISPLGAAPPPAQGVKLTPIGKPIWKPVDFHLFAASSTEFAATALALMPEP